MNLWHVVDRTIPKHIVFLGPSAGVWSYSTHSTPPQSQTLYLAPIPPPYAHSWMRRNAEPRIPAIMTSAAIVRFDRCLMSLPRDRVNRPAKVPPTWTDSTHTGDATFTGLPLTIPSSRFKSLDRPEAFRFPAFDPSDGTPWKGRLPRMGRQAAQETGG